MKEININICTLSYFDDIIKVEYFDVDNISLDEKSFENILIFEFSCKNLVCANTLK